MTAAKRSGVELLEEAVDLLRRAPVSAWAWYLAGAGPFFGAGLVFWSQVTGVTAVPDPMWGSLLMAVLFGWRQYARACFTGELYRLLTGEQPARPGFKTFAMVWFAGILRIPLLVLPFPAVIALFRNVSLTSAFKRAGALATRGSDQVVALLTIAGVSAILWVNVYMGMLLLPVLLQIFTGQEMVFLRNSAALVNGTVTLASLMVTWCMVDCVLAAFYSLRVFYGESEETGADLLGSWRRAISKAVLAVAVLMCFIPAAHAAEKPDLRQTVDQVLKEAPYQWREPLAEAKEQNAFVRWTDNLLAKLRGSIQTLKREVARFFDWLREFFGSRPAPKSNAPPSISLRAISWLVIVVLVGGLIALLMRTKLWQARGKAPAMPAGPVAIDLEDPSVLASLLPENEWVAMARDFIARGEFRMALRAYFLASLAFLASREMLAIGRSKTNLDYLGEVRRRARSVSGLDALFAGGIRAFESAWYGSHNVGSSDVEGFAANFERMRGLAGQS